MYSSSNNSVLINDIFAAALSFAISELIYVFMKQKYYAKGLMELHLIRKLLHVNTGLTAMLFWPMFSSNGWGAVLAGLVPFFGLASKTVEGIRVKNHEERIKIQSRYQNNSHLIKAVVGYVSMFAFATIFYWRTPIAIATICNLSAGDGFADIVGRRFGRWKLPYNNNKSFAGTIGMAVAGFLASIGFMYYFCWLGFIEENPNVFVFGFLIVSIASALVESHPLSTKLDDNFTVPIASMFLGTFLL